MWVKNGVVVILLCLGNCFTNQAQQQAAEQNYLLLQQKLAQGWNTWNTRSVLSHVLLPQGIAINLGLKSNNLTVNGYLHEAYLSTKEPRSETIQAGYHAYDGSYTECMVRWEGIQIRVESAHDGVGLVLLITPMQVPLRPASLVVEVGTIWNRPGIVTVTGNDLLVRAGTARFRVQGTAPTEAMPLPLMGHHLVLSLKDTLGVSVGVTRNLQSIRTLIASQRAAFEATLTSYGSLREAYLVQQSALAWNQIFDPELQRVVAPVSRCWNTFFGGQYVLFNWDTYLSAYMAGLDNRALAYANAVEVTKAIDRYGMVPNYVAGGG